MSNIEELGLRLTTQGVPEATNGVSLMGSAADKLANQLDLLGVVLDKMNAKLDGLGTKSLPNAKKETEAFVGPLQLTGAALEKYHRELAIADERLKNHGKTNREVSAAMRLLPAQITDIVTSLASGQPAYLVAIQQGGQLKDSFGSMGAAARAVGSYFPIMALGAVGAATAVGVLAAAHQLGSGEARAYLQALTLTGNASGMTVDRLSDMAGELDNVIGTQREAAATLTQFVERTNAGGQSLMQFAELAMRMERVTGQSVDKTVQVFAELEKSPLSAAAKLNERVNFLTIDLYKQIKALEEQKRFTEAAALAQNAYANTVGQRLKDLEGNLGSLEKAWNFVKRAAAEGWDAILGIGRDTTKTDQLKTAQIALEQLNKPGRKSQDPVGDEARKKALIERISLLQSDMIMERRAADQQARSTAVVRDFIAADKDKKTVQDAGKSTYDRLNQALRTNLDLDREEIGQGTRLVESEKAYLQVLRDITENEKELGETRARDLRLLAEKARASREEVEWLRAANEAQADLEKRAKQTADKAVQDTAQVQKRLDALAEETHLIGLNAEALMFHRIVNISNEQAQKSAQLAKIQGIDLYKAEATELERQIALLEQMRGLEITKYRKTEQAEIDKDNKKRTDEIAKSIEDGILEGFRGGRSISETFIKEVKAQFARQVLRVPVQFLANAGSDLMNKGVGVIGSLFNGLFNKGNMDPAYPTDNTGPRAWGGGVEPNGTYLVGERGPEILRMGRQRGQVVSNRETPRSLGGQGGGGGNVIQFAPNINIDSRTDKAEIMGLVGRAMRSAQADLLDKMNRRMA